MLAPLRFGFIKAYAIDSFNNQHSSIETWELPRQDILEDLLKTLGHRYSYTDCDAFALEKKPGVQTVNATQDLAYRKSDDKDRFAGFLVLGNEENKADLTNFRMLARQKDKGYDAAVETYLKKAQFEKIALTLDKNAHFSVQKQ